MTLPGFLSAIAGLLRGDPAVARWAKVVVADEGDVFAEVEKAAADDGLCVLVELASWTPRGQAPSVPVGDAAALVTVVERPGVSRLDPAAPTGLALACHAACALSLARADGATLALDSGGIRPAYDAATGTASHTLAVKAVASLSPLPQAPRGTPAGGAHEP